MSYTTIKAIYPKVRHESIEELHNSWGSAPFVWDNLSQKYLNAKPYTYLLTVQKLWPIWKDANIPAHHRALLMITFDRVCVAQKDYARMASDIRKFLLDFPENTEEVVNHWPHIAEFFESNPDIPAIGLYLTSVSEDPFLGKWNEDEGCYEPTDWSNVYDLYASLDSGVDTILGE